MEGSEVFLLALSASEVQELFSRCLRSVEPDTAASETVLKKLASLIEREAATSDLRAA